MYREIWLSVEYNRPWVVFSTTYLCEQGYAGLFYIKKKEEKPKKLVEPVFPQEYFCQ